MIVLIFHNKFSDHHHDSKFQIYIHENFQEKVQIYTYYKIQIDYNNLTCLKSVFSLKNKIKSRFGSSEASTTHFFHKRTFIVHAQELA